VQSLFRRGPVQRIEPRLAHEGIGDRRGQRLAECQFAGTRQQLESGSPQHAVSPPVFEERGRGLVQLQVEVQHAGLAARSTPPRDRHRPGLAPRRRIHWQRRRAGPVARACTRRERRAATPRWHRHRHAPSQQGTEVRVREIRKRGDAARSPRQRLDSKRQPEAILRVQRRDPVPRRRLDSDEHPAFVQHGEAGARLTDDDGLAARAASRERQPGIVQLDGESIHRGERLADHHLPHDVLVEVVLGIEHGTLLAQLDLVQQEHDEDAEPQRDQRGVEGDAEALRRRRRRRPRRPCAPAAAPRRCRARCRRSRSQGSPRRRSAPSTAPRRAGRTRVRTCRGSADETSWMLRVEPNRCSPLNRPAAPVHCAAPAAAPRPAGRNRASPRAGSSCRRAVAAGPAEQRVAATQVDQPL
jgi:hypothetical protein